MLVHCSLHKVLSKDRDTAANCCLSDRISYVDQMLSSRWKNGAKEKKKKEKILATMEREDGEGKDGEGEWEENKVEREANKEEKAEEKVFLPSLCR